MKVLDAYYEGISEPLQSYLFAVQRVILDLDSETEVTWKWSAPFFLYRKKMLCYVWLDKKTKAPYLGIYGGDALQHPALVQKDNAKIKKLLLRTEEDIPVTTIREVLQQACVLIRERYKT